MTTIRAFIAIELPQEIRAHLAAVSEQLAAELPRAGVRWVQPERMHLTLRFLGDTPVSRLEGLAGALDETAIRHSAFNLALQGLGCFPNCRRPRVIWAGLGGDLAAVRALKAAVDERLVAWGWAVENEVYQPHLTLGRVKDRLSLSDRPWTVSIAPLRFRISAFHLVESELRSNGPVYTIRHTSTLEAEPGSGE